jgi:ribosomal protein S10
MTQSLTLRSHVGADGLLHLKTPTALTETDLEVTILIRPVVEDNRQPEKFSEWWSKRLTKFPDAADKAAERELRYEYLEENYQR